MRIYLDMVGCRLNQSEIEKFAFELRHAGHSIVPSAETADLAIVNTCTVTASAAADSRKVIRRIARAGCERIITTGCLSTIDPDQIANLPSVEKIVVNQQKDDLVALVPPPIGEDSGDASVREPLPGKNKRTRAFIKVQDGCDNYCTFCVTRIARGKSRSIKKEEIFRDVDYALQGGVKEIVLTGVNLGSWGGEFNRQNSLASLINDLIEKFNIPRIRLSSIEPWDIDGRLLELLSHPTFCPHLHLPLQSGCDRTLRRMGRRITTDQFEQLVGRVREINEKVALTTDVIVGFPGESDQDFEESLRFIKKCAFAGGHVFRFSPRAGTPANSYLPKVSEKVKKERSKRMREAILASERMFRRGFIGDSVHVLWERSNKLQEGGYRLSGLSGNYLPITSISPSDEYNEISCVQIDDIKDEKLTGRITGRDYF